MAKLGWIVACATMALVTPALACGGAPICTVKDPTGTPLNIRMAPKGKIIGTAKNGTRLEFIDHQEIRGKRWARVARFDEGSISGDEGGWVFASYLKCESTTRNLPAEPYSGATAVPCTVQDPTGTPLNVREVPNGEIYATLRNGVVVRANAARMHKGKPWVFVDRWPDDNAVGWVFDDYMICDEDSG
jgi:hypothetical protein